MKLPLSLAALAFVASCAAPHKDMGPFTRTTCSSDPCRIKVVARGCDNVKTDPKILDVSAARTIEWEIHQNPGTSFTFTRNGIEFKSGGGGGFSGHGGGGSTRFTWHNNNSVKGDHHYNVNVTQDGGRTICTEDPTIVNH
ncbi:MAG TPA: hypothetical protein VM073_01285 [Usitatibacter sp.]|nr:hypothetical protein [Usitatibacter sp.]